MARKADPSIHGRLLAAARAEFSLAGLDGARISSITGRAGVSKGAFYLHFESKEHAFEEVATDFLGTFFRMMEGLNELLETETDFAKLNEEMHRRDVAMLEFLYSERAFALLVFEGARSARHCHLIEAFAKRVQDQVEVLLGIDKKHGRLREGVDVKLLAGFIAGGFDRYARLLLAAEEKPDISADLLQLTSFMCCGMMSPNFMAAVSQQLLTPPPLALPEAREMPDLITPPAPVGGFSSSHVTFGTKEK